MSGSLQVKDVFTISERDSGTAEGGRERWTKIGIGFVNRDESINIILDAVPINGRLHIRDRRPSANNGAASAPPHEPTYQTNNQQKGRRS